MRLFLLLIAFFMAGPGNSPGPAVFSGQGETVRSAPPAHDFHLTYARVAIEGTDLMIGLRFFRDDLETTLQMFADEEDLRLAVDPRIDSLLSAYVNDKLEIEFGGEALSGTIAASGEDIEGSEIVWWYAFQYSAPSGAEFRFEMSNRLMFETFADQKNIVKIQHFPSEKTETYYLTPESPSLVFEWD